MSFLPTVAASVPTHRGCPPGAKPAEHSPQWLWGPRYSLGAACHSIQLSSYKHHSLAPHRTAPHASPLRACRQHHELLPREPLNAPATSPEPRARAQDTARSSRPRSPASRRHAALPRNCSPPPPSTSCPGPSNRLRRHVAKGGLGAARGLWGGRGGGAAGFLSAAVGAIKLFFFSLRFSSFLTSLKWRCLEKVL